MDLEKFYSSSGNQVCMWKESMAKLLEFEFFLSFCYVTFCLREVSLTNTYTGVTLKGSLECTSCCGDSSPAMAIGVAATAAAQSMWIILSDLTSSVTYVPPPALCREPLNLHNEKKKKN